MRIKKLISAALKGVASVGTGYGVFFLAKAAAEKNGLFAPLFIPLMIGAGVSSVFLASESSAEVLELLKVEESAK